MSSVLWSAVGSRKEGDLKDKMGVVTVLPSSRIIIMTRGDRPHMGCGSWLPSPLQRNPALINIHKDLLLKAQLNAIPWTASTLPDVGRPVR
jgi:hypothetical protein